MNKTTKKEIKHCLSLLHDPLPGDHLGGHPGTINQHRHWLKQGWIKKRTIYVLTRKGWGEILQ